MASEYNDEELGRLRSAIVGLRYQDRVTVQAVENAVSDGQCPAYLAPFWNLVTGEEEGPDDPGLFRKLSFDPLIPIYSFYGFFPGIYPRVYVAGARPRIVRDVRARGPVALLRFDNGEGVAIKPLQNSREATIAQLAADGGVGPRQLQSLDGFITEELVPGCFFTELPGDSVDSDFMYLVGERLGRMLLSLHAAQIYYNDATLSDPEGRSHLILDLKHNGGITSMVDARLIDFGVSVLLDNHPSLELEEVFDIARTTPEFRLMTRFGIQGGELRQFLLQYRQRLAAVSKEDFMARDLRFTEEGLQQAAQRMGPEIVAPFREGFEAGYY